MFTLKKPNFAIIYDPYGSSNYDNDTYQSGRGFYGLTIGYKKTQSENIFGSFYWRWIFDVKL